MSLSMASPVVGFGQAMNQSVLTSATLPTGRSAHGAGDMEGQWWVLFPQKVSHMCSAFLVDFSETLSVSHVYSGLWGCGKNRSPDGAYTCENPAKQNPTEPPTDAIGKRWMGPLVTKQELRFPGRGNWSWEDLLRKGWFWQENTSSTTERLLGGCLRVKNLVFLAHRSIIPSTEDSAWQRVWPQCSRADRVRENEGAPVRDGSLGSQWVPQGKAPWKEC